MKPIDAEDVVQAHFNACGINAAAVPLPNGFESRLPFALVTRAGGQTRHEAADTHVLSIDVYASTWADATEAANRCVECFRGLDGAFDGAVKLYDADANMPYKNPDPRHSDLPRETFTATLTAAGME